MYDKNFSVPSKVSKKGCLTFAIMQYKKLSFCQEKSEHISYLFGLLELKRGGPLEFVVVLLVTISSSQD